MLGGDHQKPTPILFKIHPAHMLVGTTDEVARGGLDAKGIDVIPAQYLAPDDAGISAAGIGPIMSYDTRIRSYGFVAQVEDIQ